MERLRQLLTHMGTLMSRPGAFLLPLVYMIVWLVFDSATLDWHGFATLATWLMTLFIQRTEHRDTQAIQAKLDELLHSDARAANRLTRLDDKEPEDIEDFREAQRKGD